MKTQYNFILDFSFDGERLTIFELGDFFTSSLTRLDRLRRTEGKESLEKEFMTELRSTYPSAIYINVKADHIFFHDFSANHKELYSYRSEHTVEQLLQYRGQLGQHQDLIRPIIATLEYLPSIDARTSFVTLTNEKFQLLNYPKGVLREAARDKTTFHAFTTESAICPKTMLLDLRDDDIQLHLNTFFEQHDSSHYVIKPTSLTLGKGVSIVTRQEAQLLLQKLRNAMRLGSSIDIGDWGICFSQKNYFALVQTCVPSKRLMFEDKPYRPTGRAIMTATFNEEDSSPVLTCLGRYWELPKWSELESFSEASLVSPDDDDCVVLPIDDADWQKIKQEISDHLTPVLSNMHATSLAQLVQKFQFSSAMQAYATHLGLNRVAHSSSEEAIPQESDLERKIISIFEQLKYCSFQTKQKPRFFQQAMISNAMYEEEAESPKELPLPTLVNSNLPLSQRKAYSSAQIPRRNFTNRHQIESIQLLSRHNVYTLGCFIFYTGVLSLISGVMTQRNGLLEFGMFGILTGFAVKSAFTEEVENLQRNNL